MSINDINNTDEDFLEEDILLYSTLPGPRIFTLNNASSTTLLGVLLEETDDSFLVALPSRLINNESELKIDPFMAVPYIRLMKSGILATLYPFGVFKEKYTEYLINHGAEIYPDISDIVEELKLEEPEPIQASQDQPVGMKKEELEEYLSDKLNKGEILSGNRSKH